MKLSILIPRATAIETRRIEQIPRAIHESAEMKATAKIIGNESGLITVRNRVVTITKSATKSARQSPRMKIVEVTLDKPLELRNGAMPRAGIAANPHVQNNNRNSSPPHRESVNPVRKIWPRVNANQSETEAPRPVKKRSRLAQKSPVKRPKLKRLSSIKAPL